MLTIKPPILTDTGDILVETNCQHRVEWSKGSCCSPECWLGSDSC